MPSDSNLTEWQSRIEDLRAKGFIDMHTRFVYVSLNVYNVATVHQNPNPNPDPDPDPDPNPNPNPNEAAELLRAAAAIGGAAGDAAGDAAAALTEEAASRAIRLGQGCTELGQWAQAEG